MHNQRRICIEVHVVGKPTREMVDMVTNDHDQIPGYKEVNNHCMLAYSTILNIHTV